MLGRQFGGVQDPNPTTKSCGKPGEPKCDAYIILPGQIPQITLTFLDPGQCVGALCNPYHKEVGLADIINGTGSPITSLEATFLLAGFTFPNCGEDGNGGLLPGTTVFAACQLISGGTGSGTYSFTDGTLASVTPNGDDWTGGAVGVGTYVPDGDSDDIGMVLALVPAAGEVIPDLTKATASLSLPEPPSGLLFSLVSQLWAWCVPDVALALPSELPSCRGDDSQRAKCTPPTFFR